MKRKSRIYFGHCILLLFIGFQFAFINADPHESISTSRGPFTDEGLNTFQARNFINHGTWQVAEGDNLIKSPLFNGLLAGLLPMTGNSRTYLRFSLLILCLALWYTLALILNNFLLPSLFLIFGGFQYHLFQFYHFTMAEMLVISVTLLSLGFAYRYLFSNNKQKLGIWPLLGCFSMVYIALLLKIQNAYLLALPFMVCVLAIIENHRSSNSGIRHLGVLIVALIAGGAALTLAWYLPNQEIFDKVWSHQGQSRFSNFENAWQVFTDSGKYLLWNDRSYLFAFSFMVSFPPGIFLLFKTKDKKTKALVSLALIWLLLELHKPFILYLPSRYALSLFAAQALWMAVIAYGYLTAVINPWLKLAPLLFVAPLLIGHVQNVDLLWSEKKQKSQEVIEHYNKLDLKGKTVVGVWATSLVWNSEAYVIPVWKNFVNDDELIINRQPSIIVTEKDELDSEGVFIDRGIKLQVISDSVNHYQYGPYEVQFYYMSY